MRNKFNINPKRLEYNGFDCDDDYFFVRGIVEDAIEGNDKIHTYAVRLNRLGKIAVNLNDVTLTVDATLTRIKEFLSSFFGQNWHDYLREHLTEQINNVCEKEGWN